MQISDRARETVFRAERALHEPFSRAEATEMITQQRVLEAFHKERVSTRHFSPTNGYGYDDIGRDTLDRVFAHALIAESALVRPQFANGTHALYTMLSGICRYGDTILSITGKPYDTMEQAVGLSGNAPHSLKCQGVNFSCVDLNENGYMDVDAIYQAIRSLHPNVIYAQRSRGYAWREAFSISELQYVFSEIRKIAPNVIIAVDNCYGEFTEASEPISIGADIMAASLIKNPGGGLAPTGGYVAGRADLVEKVAQRMTIPGVGGEVGSYAASYRPFYQGLFMAPHTVCQCIKSATLFSKVFADLGFETLPTFDAHRSDIIQAVRFRSPEKLIAFCRTIQHAAPVDSFVDPEPWDMPGYEDKVVMAAGTFVQGATTELSADGPIREPYIAYLQGALTYSHARIAAMMVVDALDKF